MQSAVWMRIKASIGTALAIGLAIGATLSTTNSAEAQGAMPAPAIGATVQRVARPISAWTQFCQRHPVECAIDPRAPTVIALTPAIWQTINTVNRRVNKSLIAATDEQHWNVADRWDFAEDGVGDCEDFQLVKRRQLVEAGLSRRAMRMTVVIDEKGEGHAVLTILTNRGDLILDNKTNAVLPWAQTGYAFVKRERQDAIGWASLGGATSPATTANR